MGFSRFSAIQNPCTQITKKWTQNLPSRAETDHLGPTWRYHGSSWAQLATNFAHLAPIFAATSAKIPKKSHHESQEAPQDRPKPLQDVPETLPGRPQDAQTYNFKEFLKTSKAKRSKVTPTVVSKSS